jgi:hypothetical protein
MAKNTVKWEVKSRELTKNLCALKQADTVHSDLIMYFFILVYLKTQRDYR